MNIRLFALAAFLAFACNHPGETPAAAHETSGASATTAEAAPTGEDSDNLLDLSRGAAVVSRSGESNLDQSAVHAIDGFGPTMWVSTPGGVNETLVFSLAAPSRIDRIGITPERGGSGQPLKMRFEASADGASWREVALLEIRDASEPQLSTRDPFDAAYLRVSTVDAPGYYTRISTIHAYGKPLEPAKPRDFGGCWTINGLAAQFVQDGAHVAGIIDTNPPTRIDGGTNGEIAKLMWVRGPIWGFATMTMPPGGQALSATTFFREIAHFFQGPSWFGEPCARSANAPLVPAGIPAQLLDGTGRWSMYGLAFDDADRLLDAPSRVTLDALQALLAASPERLRIVAHDARSPDAAKNRRRSEARLAQLRDALARRGVDAARVELVAAGSDRLGVKINARIQRVLLTRIDLERATR